nr:hypothetical protein CFP56_38096 [Quercus suber]
MNHWAKWDDESLLLNMKREAIMGYQCSMVIEERYQVAKARAEELSNDNEDLLRKISDVMNKVNESERLRFVAEKNTKAITKRAKALENELQEAKIALVVKDAELRSYVPEVQQNLQVYFTKGWTAILDKLEVEAASPLRLECNVPIPEELVIIPNPEIQAIINDKSPIHEVERTGPIAISGGEITSSVVVSATDEPPQV